MRYVIIGNGVASVGAIEGIRKHDQDGSILVISSEDKATYGRPLISYYLAGKVKAEKMALRPESFYADNKVQVRLDTRVTAVDPKAHTITTAGGETIAYDKLLVATGGVPSRIPVENLDGPGVYSFTTWADAEALKEILPKAERFVIVGAGLIALKAAEALALAGKHVTLVVRSRIMRVYFDEPAGELVMRHLKAKGVEFKEDASPKAILRDEQGVARGVSTTQGDVAADAVILAAGVSPCTELAKAAGLEVGSGILVDERMATSDPDIFAAGDVAEAHDILAGERRVTPIWPSAYNQGVNAGINMAGANLAYPGGLAMNAITFFGLPTITVGLTNPPAEGTFEVHTDVDPEKLTYRKLIFTAGAPGENGERLVGLIMVGDVDHAGLYASFIRNGLPLDADAKREILAGTPSPLYWPRDFYAQKMASA